MKVKELIAKLQEYDNDPSFWRGIFLSYFITDVILDILK